MRFITQAYRIRYGIAIFVFFFPDDIHNLLMVRLSRTRRNDPVWQDDKKKPCQRVGDWNEPNLNDICEEDVVVGLSKVDVTGSVPTHD